MAKILIIASENNSEANCISKYLKRDDFFILNLSKIHSNYSISLNHNECYFEIKDENTNKLVASNQLKTIWLVSEKEVFAEGFENNNELASFFRNEYSMLLNGIISCAEELKIKVINPPHKIFFAGDKTRQMLVAKKVGFKLPNQIITNRISKFIAQTWSKKSVSKPIHSSNLIYKEDKTLFSKPVNITEKVYQAIIDDTVELTVHHFQEKLDFICEFRVVCFNKEVFPFKINGEYELDWRDYLSSITIEFDQSFPLKNECLDYMDFLDIKLGAFDFIQTNDGLYFIECNAPGFIEFCDPQNKTGILSQFAEYLIQ